MESFVSKVINLLREAVAAATIDNVVKEMTFVVSSVSSMTGWPYLLSSLVVVFVLYRWRRRSGEYGDDHSFARVVWPKAIYGHPSAITDYKFVLLDKALRPFLYVPFFAAASYVLYRMVQRQIGDIGFDIPAAWAPWILPLVLLLAVDFSVFAGHWLMHRIPFLWPFHEVHHSAEVLTPFTVYRIHPVEELVSTMVTAVITALVAALFTATTNVGVGPLSIFGVHALKFGFFVFGFQLRHSHVWLSYGRVWSRVFISPAQHQVHHSVAAKHWNKNYGFIFAFWDLIFRSLYVPAEREEIVFGCGTPSHEYSTVPRLYFRPFVKSARALKRMARALLTPRTLTGSTTSKLEPPPGVERDEAAV
jgi:sterol desaturase/sphingolipid hydroxylase (fatty acid hydroxylase superfamily)